MLDSSECAGIIEAMADYLAPAAEDAQPSKAGQETEGEREHRTRVQFYQHMMQPVAEDAPPSSAPGCNACIGTYCLSGEICRKCGHAAESQGIKQPAQPSSAPQDYSGWDDMVDHVARNETATLRQLAAQRQPQDEREGWQRVTAPGQVKVGDKLRFTIGDKAYSEKAKLILNAGREGEEVIYDKSRNYYFITKCVLSGFSNHKNVEFRRAALTAREGE
jgi:hypothetical protein